MTKMTAEQVKLRLRHLAETDELGLKNANAAYEHAGDLIRNHLTETDEQRRERFEAWWRKLYGPSFDHMLARDCHGYANGSTNMMWLAFQAALTWRCETKGGGQDG